MDSGFNIYLVKCEHIYGNSMETLKKIVLNTKKIPLKFRKTDLA